MQGAAREWRRLLRTLAPLSHETSLQDARISRNSDPAVGPGFDDPSRWDEEREMGIKNLALPKAEESQAFGLKDRHISHRREFSGALGFSRSARIRRSALSITPSGS